MVKRIVTGIIILLSGIFAGVNATVLPDNVQDFVKTDFPQAVFRFDGMVILPDNTAYLPLIPSKFNKDFPANIKYTIPENKTLAQKPDAIVLSNDYVLLRLIKNNKGKNTILSMEVPPVEIMTGLLPQDLLVPKNFIIPESMKNIIGNLDVRTYQDNGLIVPVAAPKGGLTTNSLEAVPQLKNKIMYILSSISRHIQVVNPAKGYVSYALFQDNVPICLKGYDVFLLVTSFGKKSVDIISLTDDKIIKEVDLPTQPDEILIDGKNKLAYISSGEDASMYVLSLETMTLKRQLRLNGMCEKAIISEDGTKLFYNDKQTREIWAVELDNGFVLKLVGKFPNVSKMVYKDGKLYITSRTKNRLAIIDYETMGLMSENPTTEKPVDMYVYKDNLFVLGAANHNIDVIDTSIDTRSNVIDLPDNIFPTKIIPVEDSSFVIITDAKANIYTIVDFETQKIVQTNKLDIPVNSMYIAKSFKKIGSK